MFRDEEAHRKLDEIAGLLSRIATHLHRQGMAIMNLEELTTAIDSETNAVAAKIDHLSKELAAAVAAGQAPKPETLAALSAISDRLKTLGADPATPIPAPPVVAPPPVPAPVEPAPKA
jgi:hypothetical protein